MADEIKDDPRVQEMARILLFVINNMKDALVVTPITFKTQSLHDWCEKALTDAGYELTKSEPKPAPKRRKRKE